MWSKVAEHLKSHPERLEVAKILVENGLAVRNGKILCNDIEVSTIQIAKVSKVDRRTVVQTRRMIENIPELQAIFKNLRSAGHSLKEISKYLNLGVLEITPYDAKTPGILASAAQILAEKKISIRQALVDDPELSPEPTLTLIVEKKIPGELIPQILQVNGVAKVSVY